MPPYAEVVANTAESSTKNEKDSLLQGRYEVVKTLSVGTQGKVKLAIDKTRDNTTVAIKVTDKLEGVDASQEINVYNLLPYNNNVIEFIEAFEIGTKDYMVFELMEGDLFDLLAEHDHFPLDICVEVMRQVLEGLKHLHTHGVAHRDLKPENILLNHTDFRLDTLVVKLTDFGLSAMFDNDNVSLTLCGSESYTAPEILEKPKTGYSAPPVDIWSAGIVLYNMFTSFSPWSKAIDHVDDAYTVFVHDKKSFWAWSRKHSVQPIPNGFSELINGMCHPDPEARWTADDCLASSFFERPCKPA